MHLKGVYKQEPNDISGSVYILTYEALFGTYISIDFIAIFKNDK